MSGSEIDAAAVLQALGDPTRRAIVERLSQGPASVSGLAGPLGITLTAVSQHLQILEHCGLARTEKLGRVRTCRLETLGLEALEQWIKDRRGPWAQRLDRLGEILGEAGD